jgi:hypothetical protein
MNLILSAVISINSVRQCFKERIPQTKYTCPKEGIARGVKTVIKLSDLN